MNIESELKPCPFCGGEAETIRKGDGVKRPPLFFMSDLFTA